VNWKKHLLRVPNIDNEKLESEIEISLSAISKQANEKNNIKTIISSETSLRMGNNLNPKNYRRINLKLDITRRLSTITKYTK
jgi:hypothetical protein